MLLRHMEAFLRYHRNNATSEAAISWYRRHLAKYIDYLSANSLAHSADSVHRFIDSLSCTDSGKAGYWRAIRAMQNWMQEYYPDESERLDRIRLRFSEPLPRQSMPDEYFARTIEQIGESAVGRRDRMLYILLRFTALRSNEAGSLTVEQIDFVGRALTVIGKRNKPRAVPVCQSVAVMLGAYLKQVGISSGYVFRIGKKRPVNISNTDHRWLKYQRLAGLPRTWRVHDIRHTCASDLYDKGMDLQDLQKLLGHSTIQVTQIYAKFSVGRLKREIDRYYK
jgi:site-specific recombinase XerD